MSKSERVPAALQSQYDKIVALTDLFCQRHLNEEYRDLCRRMAATLCRKRPSPVATGKTKTWACGIVYSVGRINFLFDKSQTLHLRADELCQHFGLRGCEKFDFFACNPLKNQVAKMQIGDFFTASQTSTRYVGAAYDFSLSRADPYTVGFAGYNQRAAIPLPSSAPYGGCPFPQERHAGGVNRRTHE